MFMGYTYTPTFLWDPVAVARASARSIPALLPPVRKARGTPSLLYLPLASRDRPDLL